MQTFEFCGTLIFAQADLNFSYAKILRIQPEFGKINVFLLFILQISIFAQLFDPKIVSFFEFFFCASCATKFFRTNDYALREWMLLKALWYDDATCPWSHGPNFYTY